MHAGEGAALQVRAVERLSEARHGHIDGVGRHVVRGAPDALGDGGSGDDCPLLPEQELEQAKRLRAKVQGRRSVAHRSAGGIHRKGPRLQVGFLRVRRGGVSVGPPREGPEAGQQLLEGERLGEIVVGPGVEAGDAVIHVLKGREHEHGRSAFLAPQPLDERAPVHAREPPVDDENVVGARKRLGEAVLPPLRPVDLVPLLFEPPFNRPGDVGLVLDEQEPFWGGSTA